MSNDIKFQWRIISFYNKEFQDYNKVKNKINDYKHLITIEIETVR